MLLIKTSMTVFINDMCIIREWSLLSQIILMSCTIIIVFINEVYTIIEWIRLLESECDYNKFY